VNNVVRILEERTFVDGKKYIEGACVAADVAGLPTSGIVTGSKMTVADSGDVYMFAEGDSPAWTKIAAGPTADG
jgi:hypothetical protein